MATPPSIQWRQFSIRWVDLGFRSLDNTGTVERWRSRRWPRLVADAPAVHWSDGGVRVGARSRNASTGPSRRKKSAYWNSVRRVSSIEGAHFVCHCRPNDCGNGPNLGTGSRAPGMRCVSRQRGANAKLLPSKPSSWMYGSQGNVQSWSRHLHMSCSVDALLCLHLAIDQTCGLYSFRVWSTSFFFFSLFFCWLACEMNRAVLKPFPPPAPPHTPFQPASLFYVLDQFPGGFMSLFIWFFFQVAEDR